MLTLGSTTVHTCLIEDLERWTHGGLDVQDLDVLPVLLQQGNQEVNSQLDVQGNIARSHGDVGNSQRHAHDLLHLELDGGLGDFNLLAEIISLIKDSRELTCLGQARTKDTRDLLDQRSRGQKVIVLLGELLDQLLVLVELLKVVHGHLVNAKLISLLAVLLVTQNANTGVRTWDNWELEGAGETFVSGRIVVLQGDLKLDTLSELADLSLDLLTLVVGDSLAARESQNVGNGRIQ